MQDDSYNNIMVPLDIELEALVKDYEEANAHSD